MTRTFLPSAAGLALLAAAAALAQSPAPPPPLSALPSVTVSASASEGVQNDRMFVTFRAEAENVTAAAAAAEVNARMEKALARARTVPGVNARTTGYSTWQTYEKGRPAKWRVTQTLALDGRDFLAVAALASRLQEEDALLVSGLHFGLSEELRRKTEDALTQKALANWRDRAQAAAQGLGFGAWRTGHVAVHTGEGGRGPQPVLRAQASPMAAAGPQVAVEGGLTELSVSVTGDALLEQPKPPAR